MTGRVVVVGALNVDLVVSADRLPGPGETVVGAGTDRYGGGKGANAAVAAARAGAEVRYCGAVGNDLMGTAALSELSDEGVDITDVAVLEGVSTGTALIVVDPAGENQIAVGAGANAAVTADMVDAAVQRSASWADCVLVSSEIAPAGVLAAVRAAHREGLRCVLNPAPVIGVLRDLAPSSPVFTPNASELGDLHTLLGGNQASSVEMMALAVARHTQAPVLVTLGEDGVVVAGPDGEVLRVPAGTPGEVRDTTGAGDTFNGVLAACLAAGASIPTAAVRAVVAASLSVAAMGARAGMPRPQEIDAAVAVAGAETQSVMARLETFL